MQFGHFFKEEEMNTFTPHAGCIKLIKRDSKYIFNVKGLY